MSDQNFSRLPKPHTTYANIIKSFLPIGDQDKSANAVLPNACLLYTSPSPRD